MVHATLLQFLCFPTVHPNARTASHQNLRQLIFFIALSEYPRWKALESNWRLLVKRENLLSTEDASRFQLMSDALHMRHEKKQEIPSWKCSAESALSEAIPIPILVPIPTTNGT